VYGLATLHLQYLDDSMGRLPEHLRPALCGVREELLPRVLGRHETLAEERAGMVALPARRRRRVENVRREAWLERAVERLRRGLDRAVAVERVVAEKRGRVRLPMDGAGWLASYLEGLKGDGWTEERRVDGSGDGGTAVMVNVEVDVAKVEAGPTRSAAQLFAWLQYATREDLRREGLVEQRWALHVETARGIGEANSTDWKHL